jgi:catechol 2,3-dioxygenase-like lactoylglutathione lyase family enzyme
VADAAVAQFDLSWIDMAITFNHTIVAAKDRQESADFFTDLFGLPNAKEFGPFLAIELNHGVSLD